MKLEFSKLQWCRLADKCVDETMNTVLGACGRHTTSLSDSVWLLKPIWQHKENIATICCLLHSFTSALVCRYNRGRSGKGQMKWKKMQWKLNCAFSFLLRAKRQRAIAKKNITLSNKHTTDSGTNKQSFIS